LKGCFRNIFFILPEDKKLQTLFVRFNDSNIFGHKVKEQLEKINKKTFDKMIQMEYNENILNI